MKVLVAEFDFFCVAEFEQMKCKIIARTESELLSNAAEVLHTMKRDANTSLPKKLSEILDSSKWEDIQYPSVKLSYLTKPNK